MIAPRDIVLTATSPLRGIFRCADASCTACAGLCYALALVVRAAQLQGAWGVFWQSDLGVVIQSALARVEPEATWFASAHPWPDYYGLVQVGVCRWQLRSSGELGLRVTEHGLELLSAWCRETTAPLLTH